MKASVAAIAAAAAAGTASAFVAPSAFAGVQLASVKVRTAVATASTASSAQTLQLQQRMTQLHAVVRYTALLLVYSLVRLRGEEGSLECMHNGPLG